VGKREDLKRLVRAALKEDLGTGDVTTRGLVDRPLIGKGRILSRRFGIISGMAAARQVFSQVDRRLRFVPRLQDGARVRPGHPVAIVRGRIASILIGERTALNFLQQLSGVATLTRTYVDQVKGTRAKIYDTRKTVPGLRFLQKEAVLAGGGRNHRMGLFDAALIKDNHIDACTDLDRRIHRIKARWIQIEARTMQEVRRFIELPIDSMLLDNFSIPQLRRAVRWIRGRRRRLEIEASGGVNLKTVRAIARTGVDRISVGELTHSAPALDLSMDIG
jgi:nicotinate-nucleotide pyrophosphorylase (carboxylating)